MNDKTNQPDNELGLIWGALNIGAALGVSERRAHMMLTKGELEGARKLNGKWCISRAKLREAVGLSEVA